MGHQPEILVTGATGTVGRQVVSQLLERGHAVRALVRDPGAAALPEPAEPVAGDLSDPDGLEAALDGIRSVFLVWPFTDRRSAVETAPAVVDAIAGRAEQVVHLSAEAAGADPESFWALVEQRVQAAAARWTVLRPTGFAKNTLIWADQIRGGDVVRWPFGAAARTLIDEVDIATAAVAALTDPGRRHDGAVHVLSGPEVLTQARQVETIGEALGQPLRWQDVPRDEARRTLVAAFGDEAFADHALDAWEGFMSTPEVITDTVREITGAPAHTLRDWAGRHADAFR